MLDRTASWPDSGRMAVRTVRWKESTGDAGATGLGSNALWVPDRAIGGWREGVARNGGGF